VTSISRYRAPAQELLTDFEARPREALYAEARDLCRDGHGNNISYSRKVFIPLTRLCRDVCGYCTFAKTPAQVSSPYLQIQEVLAIAQAGKGAGCREALFTLGDKPELRYAVARKALAEFGFRTTVEYLAFLCDSVLRETGLLPHVNAGLMSEEEIAELRRVSVSQGIMLESASSRLCEQGGPHFGSPDKDPRRRLEMITAAGRQRVPFTSGILVGIGETRLERIQSFLALRGLHERHGHLQEVIVQNFRAKPGTRMAGCTEPGLDDLMWTAAVARLIFGARMNIQVPPNLSYNEYPRLLSAGINDWGGISPVTADHVNPEAPWPHLAELDRRTADAGFCLTQRLAVYPRFALAAAGWQHADLASRVLSEIDAEGFARCDSWSPGIAAPLPARGPSNIGRRDPSLSRLLDRAASGDRLGEDDVMRLFAARGPEVDEVGAAADVLRRKTSGDVVRYVVNRNINYTNICYFKCQFCAFSKGKLAENLRGRPYDLGLDEVARRCREAWDRGATEVCMQGGINPDYTGATYLGLIKAVKDAVPGMHIHAFSPLEVAQGATTLGLSAGAFLEKLRDAGLGTLPGTAAEILDDDIRAIICPDKVSTRQWLDVVMTAHHLGLRTTATIMFGHIETPRSWARHLLHIRDLQARTGGFTEFVPLPFVHMEAPMYRKGGARKGPTWREVILIYAVSRLVLHPLITNIQVSWVKLGPERAAAILGAGANDLGGTLMNESISRAAGTEHGQELPPEQMEELIRSAVRHPQQRTTLYEPVDEARRRLSFAAAPLAEIVQTKLHRRHTGKAAASLPKIAWALVEKS
jgi:FO synthase